MFRKATKERAKLRLALDGPSGSGKTYTALTLARTLAGTGRVAVIDTEHGSASKYAGDFDFDVVDLDTFEPRRYVEAIKAAADGGYPVLIIDSLSHAWSGVGGALDQVDKRGGKFNAWRDVTPMHNELVNAILGYPGHVIATLRVKQAFEVTKDDRGKTEVVKLGLAPVQKSGIEYEFDVVGSLNQQHTLTVTKSRCRKLADQVIRRPGEDVAQVLLGWLEDGTEPLHEQILRMVREGDVSGAKQLTKDSWKRIQRNERQACVAAIEAAEAASSPAEDAAE